MYVTLPFYVILWFHRSHTHTCTSVQAGHLAAFLVVQSHTLCISPAALHYSLPAIRNDADLIPTALTDSADFQVI